MDAAWQSSLLTLDGNLNVVILKFAATLLAG